MSDEHTIKAPFGDLVFVGSPEGRDTMQALVTARGHFVVEYARAQGWVGPDEEFDTERLTLDQILEIRAQPGWKEPLKARA